MASIRTIGASGQISLGKEYAGQMVIIDQLEKGTWVIKVGAFIPDSERWLHDPTASELLSQAIAWAEANGPAETSLDDLASRIGE